MNTTDQLLTVAIAALTGIFAMIVLCAYHLDRINKNTAMSIATIRIHGTTGAGGKAGADTGEAVRRPRGPVTVTPGPHLIPKTRAIHVAQQNVEFATDALRAANDDLAKAEAKAAMSKEERAFEAAKEQSKREDDAADKAAREKAVRNLRWTEALAVPKTGENTPEDNVAMSLRVANVTANKVLASRIDLSASIKGHPFEPAHSEALIKLHNAVGVAHREFQNAVKAAPTNADTFGV